jgi:hypothetical protein
MRAWQWRPVSIRKSHIPKADFSGPIRLAMRWGGIGRSENSFRVADRPPGISVSLQVEHKQLIGNGHLIGSSLW